MRTLVTVPLFALFILSSPSTAQEAEPKQETAEEEQEEKKPPRIYWDNGLWFRPRRTNFRMKVGGQAQNDTAGFASHGTQPATLDGGVEWRRARAYALGSFGRRWSFKFQWALPHVTEHVVKAKVIGPEAAHQSGLRIPVTAVMVRPIKLVLGLADAVDLPLGANNHVVPLAFHVVSLTW